MMFHLFKLLPNGRNTLRVWDSVGVSWFNPVLFFIPFPKERIEERVEYKLENKRKDSGQSFHRIEIGMKRKFSIQGQQVC